MAMTDIEHDDHGDSHGDDHAGGHHETPESRDQKERMALWLLIAGDGLFLVLEIFVWFYLRALNTNGGWIFAKCTTAIANAQPGNSRNLCTNGLANVANSANTAITAPIPKADPTWGIIVAVLIVVAALLAWGAERASRERGGRGAIGGLGALFFVFVLASIVMQIVQFQELPFTTVDGAYASTYEFFMGSTLAHLLLVGFIAYGLWHRAQKNMYADGRYYRLRIIRIFTVWVAVSTIILVGVSALFY